MKTENSATFFANKDCKFYPCHKCDEDINCLFCYCPLYDRDCPGNFTYTETGGRSVKSCINCTFPHIADNYPEVIRLLKQ